MYATFGMLAISSATQREGASLRATIKEETTDGPAWFCFGGGCFGAGHGLRRWRNTCRRIRVSRRLR